MENAYGRKRLLVQTELLGMKKPGADGVPGLQTENIELGKIVLGRCPDACRISQIEGTEKSTSLLLSEVVCRA
jgi:hypothetical protein